MPNALSIFDHTQRRNACDYFEVSYGYACYVA